MTAYVNDITTTTRITPITCGECGVVFGMSAEFLAARKEDKRDWYCPNGHSRTFTGRPEAELLRQRLDWAKARETSLRDPLDSTERARRAYKGQVTRIKRRVSNGVCPCCNRTFADLAKHMAGQHPDFAEPTA